MQGLYYVSEFWWGVSGDTGYTGRTVDRGVQHQLPHGIIRDKSQFTGPNQAVKSLVPDRCLLYLQFQARYEDCGWGKLSQ
jgi:hypothetical protein